MKRFRILVVDDEERIVHFLTTKLKASGYEVFTASDGVAGLEQAQAQEPQPEAEHHATRLSRRGHPGIDRSTEAPRRPKQRTKTGGGGDENRLHRPPNRAPSTVTLLPHCRPQPPPRQCTPRPFTPGPPPLWSRA